MTTGLESRMDHRVFEADELSTRLPNLVNLTLFYVPSSDSEKPYVRINVNLDCQGTKISKTKKIFDENQRDNASAFNRYNELRGKILKGEYTLKDLGEKLVIRFL